MKIALAHNRDLPSVRAFGDPAQSGKNGKQYLPSWERALRK